MIINLTDLDIQLVDENKNVIAEFKSQPVFVKKTHRVIITEGEKSVDGIKLIKKISRFYLNVEERKDVYYIVYENERDASDRTDLICAYDVVMKFGEGRTIKQCRAIG